jgi:hypothetical protein
MKTPLWHHGLSLTLVAGLILAALVSSSLVVWAADSAEKDGQHYLRAATPIPIVMEKCTMCHDNYRDQKVIGALGYTLPLNPRIAGSS